MERDEIIRMARDAGFRSGCITLHSCEPLPFVAPISATDCLVELQRFAALVEAAATEKANERANASWASMCEKMVAAERDACAQVCEQQARHAGDPVTFYTAVGQCASAIRARGNQK